jgi:hypothetical protein
MEKHDNILEEPHALGIIYLGGPQDRIVFIEITGAFDWIILWATLSR